MRRRAILRTTALLVAAFAFGAVAAAIKGNGPGWRDGVGNLSAPWVLVPMLAAAAGTRGRIWVGAIVGALATITALAGFYLAEAFVLDLGPHSTLHDIALTITAGTLYARAGLVSGPLMGALGVWAARRGSRFLMAIAAALLCFEPLATYAFSRISNGWWAAGNGAWNGVYAAECMIGLCACVLLWRTRARTGPY